MGGAFFNFIASGGRIDHTEAMLNHMRIYSSDGLWRQILRDMGAVICENPTLADVNMDTLDIPQPVSPIDLQAILLAATDSGPILRQVFGRDVHLSGIGAQIIVLLYKSGGMSGAELKKALGYTSDTATHVVDTAIYQMRRQFGRHLIQNKNGVYVLGHV